MPQIHLFNTLSRKEEILKTIESDHLKIYVCGPTVYDRPHLGNARSVVIYDLFFRLFKNIFPRVTYVRNITDVDDKINAAAKERGISIQELTKKNTDFFYADIDALNVLRPTFEPRATDHIPEMIAMIQKLIAKNHAYENRGHVLFDVESYKNYGALSNRHLDEMIAGSRVEVATYKKNPLDFVLWKPADEQDDPSSIFESPWGKGRPGWHIECSAMSEKYLGADFDIHGGGADLQFPHHENEIAQSCCANDHSHFARFWIHNGFLTVNGEKMSKSLKNFITVRDLLDQGISGVVIRYLLLSTHYRKPFDFNQKALDDAQKSIEKFYSVLYPIHLKKSNYDEAFLRKNCDGECGLYQVIQPNSPSEFLPKRRSQRSASSSGLGIFPLFEKEGGVARSAMVGDFLETNSISQKSSATISGLKNKIIEHLSGDLNISKAIAFLHEIVKEIKTKNDENLKKEFAETLDFLGLLDVNFSAQKSPSIKIDEDSINSQIILRLQAKQEKNFQKADEIRKNLLAQGIILEDIAGGKTIWKFAA
jgi:cysteinyl-tRNA synthetase